MSYDYKTQRPWLFTEEGQIALLRARDTAFALCEKAGAARCDRIMQSMGGGDSWNHLAVVDRLVEIGDLREIKPSYHVSAQDRVYVRVGP